MSEATTQFYRFPEIFSEDGFQSLATEIMNKYCIKNGNYIYHPVEIEFYIYCADHQDIHVYPRDDKKPGEIFFHLSGMDICFESSLEKGCFGGILIRALERRKAGEETRIIGGPLICKDEVLNTATEKCEVKKLETPLPYKEAQKSQRQGINPDKKKQDEDTFWNKNYRFIRSDMNIDEAITRYVDTFDFSKKAPKVPKPKRSYSLKYQPPKNK